MPKEPSNPANSIRNLMMAAKIGLPHRIEEILDTGIDVNVRHDLYHCAIIQAVSNGKFEAVDLLLRHGANVDSLDNINNTPLILTDSHEIAKRLIQAGADVNHRNLVINTPIICHAYKNNALIIKELFSHGASLEDRNRSGDTALFNAILDGAIDATKTLLELGADPSVTNKRGETIADIARQSKNPMMGDLVKSFIDKLSLESVIDKNADCSDGMVF